MRRNIITVIPIAFIITSPIYPNVKNDRAKGLPSTPKLFDNKNIVVKTSRRFNRIKRQNHLWVFKKERVFVNINSERKSEGENHSIIKGSVGKPCKDGNDHDND